LWSPLLLYTLPSGQMPSINDARRNLILINKGVKTMSAQSFRAPQPSDALFVHVVTGNEELFDELKEIYQAIARRAYEFYEARGSVDGHDLDDWLRAESESLIPVHAGIEDSQRQLIVRALVPGFSGDEILVNVSPRRLIIYGQTERIDGRKTGELNDFWQLPKTIFHAVDLHAEVDLENVLAWLEDDVLEVRLRKIPMI
jgi:HSP20 family molecular chaperone IbpA